jgi:hypothetical protein
MKKAMIRFATAGVLLMLGAAASAHHSVARYDNDNLVTVEGTVSKIEWTSPHVFIYFNATAEDGTTTEWSVELDPPVLLGRYGWRRDMVKEGDRIKFTGAPAKSGAPLMRGAIVELEDGTSLRVWSRV